MKVKLLENKSTGFSSSDNVRLLIALPDSQKELIHEKFGNLSEREFILLVEAFDTPTWEGKKLDGYGFLLSLDDEGRIEDGYLIRTVDTRGNIKINVTMEIKPLKEEVDRIAEELSIIKELMT